VSKNITAIKLADISLELKLDFIVYTKINSTIKEKGATRNIENIH